MPRARSRTANLLDELGLDRRDESGTRLLPDGRPMELLIESADVSPDEDDVLELVREQWSEIGFKVRQQAHRAAGAAEPDLFGRGVDVDLLRHRQRRAGRDAAAL